MTEKYPPHWGEQVGFDLESRTITAEIWYPRCDGNPDAIEIGLCDVRAADGLRITYDFDRDGWKIEQQQVFQWSADDDECDPQWKEVAFIQAWASRKEPTT